MYMSALKTTVLSILLTTGRIALAANCQPSCASSSMSASLALDTFINTGSWTFTTPAHQNANGYINFDTTNSVLGTQTRCWATSTRLTDFFYGMIDYECEDDVTSFSFSQLNDGLLEVNTTWSCDAEGKTFQGTTGQINLGLECDETYWQNPNWTMGQLYSSRQRECELPGGSVRLPLEVTEI